MLYIYIIYKICYAQLTIPHNSRHTLTHLFFASSVQLTVTMTMTMTTTGLDNDSDLVFYFVHASFHHLCDPF